MKHTIQKLFPQTANNDYKGYKIACYAFYAIIATTIVRSCIHMFAPDGGAQTIATIPLATYSSAASDTVIQIFALWGLSQLIVGFIYTVVAIRYRNLIPLMYLFIAFEYIMRELLGSMKPIILNGTAPGGSLNIPMVILALILFILSLRTPKDKCIKM